MLTKQEIDKLWLLFFNNTLFEQKIISEEMRNKMVTRINGVK